MDAALRMNLSEALSDKLDQQILNGTEGLLNGTVLANHNVSADHVLCRLSRATSVMAASTAHLCHGHRRRIRMVVGSATYGHMAGAVPVEQRGRPRGASKTLWT